jgi:nitroreductase
MLDQLWSPLTARRNVSLRRLVAPGPDEAGLKLIVEAAAHAPDHGRLRPWRFILVPAARRPDLADVFVDALVQRDPDCDDVARAAAYDKAFHAPCLLVAILIDDPKASAVPTAEKLVSLGCAIQNMLIVAQGLQVDSGMASGGAMGVPGMRQFLRLEPHEQAVCFIGFGTATSTKPPRLRPQPEDFMSTL